jgi:hypothetical protein
MRAHKNESRLRVPGSAWLPLAVFSDLFRRSRTELGVTLKVLSKQTGIPERMIDRWETHEPGSLLLEQVVLLLHCVDCRLEIRPVRNRPRPDEPFAGLKRG